MRNGGICMSIRSKLSFSISLIVLFILVLNVVFSQINAIRVQENNVEQQVVTIANQLAITINLIDSTNRSIEQELAKRLKSSAQTVEEILDPDIANVTTEQLEELKKRLDLDDITLWIKEEEELVSVRSSNPNEVNLRSKSWDYWDVALKDVINLRPVTVAQGERSTNFYAGPINFAVTDPSKVNKWGYYYTGKTNYMINTMLNTDKSFTHGYIGGTDRVIAQLLAENDAILEITAFNPTFFGKEKIIKLKQGKPVYNLDVRDVSFGSYNFANIKSDIESVHLALNEDKFVTSDFKFGGSSLTRTFIPIEDFEPYVIGIVIDKNTLMADTHKQLIDHIIIAIILLLIAIVGSYIIAELLTSPLTKIMFKVNAISMNQFHTSLVHNSSDEFGLLASQVNTMGNNLSRYTNELKQTNIELTNTKQYLESFFKHTTDAVHIADLNNIIMQVNDAFENMFEWNSDELVGHPLSNLSLQDRVSYEQLIEQVIEGNAVTSYETIMYTKSNFPIDVSMSLSGIRDENGLIIAIASITRNITARKQTEELLLKNEKLSAIGQLAASIAHEIRNPLTTVQGFLKINYKKGLLPENHMDLVMKEIDHMNHIVGQFLVMSKPQISNLQPTNIVQLINDILLLMTSSGTMEHVTVKSRIDEDVPLINGVEGNLKQMFVNLIKNSVEAMSEDGILEIGICKQDQHVQITITDNGVGVSEESLNHLFEPFYTNKKDGNGLGLLVSQQIIANHQGTITFTSKVGVGTTATIVLPALKL